jgi:hypothetical protein
MKSGDHILVDVKTDTGESKILYIVDDIDFKCWNCGGNDCIKFRMVAGRGPSYIENKCIDDCWVNVDQNIKDGITKIIPNNEVQSIKDTLNARRPSIGIIEVGDSYIG